MAKLPFNQPVRLRQSPRSCVGILIAMGAGGDITGVPAKGSFGDWATPERFLAGFGFLGSSVPCVRGSWYNGTMESVIRNVRDIDSRERQALEHVLGQQLEENQKIIIQVITVPSEPAEHAESAPDAKLPAWCNVFAGLSDEQVAGVEEIVLQRSDLSRPSV